jgi:hypothetical protein
MMYWFDLDSKCKRQQLEDKSSFSPEHTVDDHLHLPKLFKQILFLILVHLRVVQQVEFEPLEGDADLPHFFPD